MRRATALIAGALLASGAAAQTQAQMNDTANADRHRSDNAMSRQWATTYGAMQRRDAAVGTRGGGFGYAAALLASQRAWLRFRETQCVVEGGEFAGGTAQGMTIALCHARLNRERTAQLARLERKP